MASRSLYMADYYNSISHNNKQISDQELYTDIYQLLIEIPDVLLIPTLKFKLITFEISNILM